MYVMSVFFPHMILLFSSAICSEQDTNFFLSDMYKKFFN